MQTLKVFVVDLQLQKVTSVIIRFPVCVSLFTIKRGILGRKVSFG